MEDFPKSGSHLDTVRTLHQTVVSLRDALERSRSEILELKSKAPLKSLESVITVLSVENHLLRRKILDFDNERAISRVTRVRQDVVAGEDDLGNRFKNVTSSLENLSTTKSHKKSSFRTSSRRTQSFRDINAADGNDRIFAPKITFEKRELNSTNSVKRQKNYLDKIEPQVCVAFVDLVENELATQVDSSGGQVEGIATIEDQKNYLEKIEPQICLAFVDLEENEQAIQHVDSSGVQVEGIASIEDTQDLDVNENPRSLHKDNQLHSDLIRSKHDDLRLSPEDNRLDSDLVRSKHDNLRSSPEDQRLGSDLLLSEHDNPRSSHEDNRQDPDFARSTHDIPRSSPEHDASNTDLVNPSKPNEHSKGKKISVSINLDIYRRSRKRLNFETPMDRKDDTPKEDDDPQEVVVTEEERINEGVLRHSSSTELLDQEVDDIELIFTSEDTKEANLKEPLISIDGANLQCFDADVSADVSDRELEDDVFNDNFENENQENSNFQSGTFDFANSQMYDSKSDNSINREEAKSFKSYYSYQDSSFENKSLEKDESFDRFDERIRIVETDMSKVGIQDVEYSLGRRNTCPNPLQYRPMVHREAIGRGLNTRKTRPILAHSTAIRKESGAQTDISALPSKNSWRSESSLAHKVKIGDNFTTLPSKYPLPGSRLRLSEKTVESRRVLLSDIGFTSMVPELSRSADHLFPPNLKTPSVSNYGQFLKTTDLYSPGFTSQRFMWTNASPSESHSQSRYSSLYPLPSPPAPSRRCSAPVSPCRKTVLKHMPSKVRFANGSLPELRGDWNTTIDSGDSTDSLVEEAEQYLRRSIDCIVGGKDLSCYSTTKSGVRRASAPEPARDNIPPQGWQPFLPRLPRDLRLDYWVKVISPEGRVRGGRVRFVGHLLSQSEQFVGVQLSTPEGHSDGTHNNRRYFQCEPYHGIFVPFKKVIMGWKP